MLLNASKMIFKQLLVGIVKILDGHGFEKRICGMYVERGTLAILWFFETVLELVERYGFHPNHWCGADFGLRISFATKLRPGTVAHHRCGTAL